MVNRLVFPLILIPILWALVTTATASETLSVEPDRERLYQGEVLSLAIKGTMTIDINLSNLFDFDTSSLPQPDIEKVKDDFEILAQNQRYSIQTVNGEMIGEVTWTYQLAPNKSGQLTIPSLTFRDAKSDPVTIEVVDGDPAEQSTNPRESFIELSADKDAVYVQEQLVLSIKLFFNGNMVRGELSEPSHPNAIIESLGKQTEYSRFRDGMRYRVVERRYAIFPQQKGELRLPAIRFEGQTRDASGRLKFLRDSKQLFTVPVKEVPANFTGDTWLPATELTLSETGLPNDPTINAGQNLSRSLSIVAEGLPGEALPPFSHDTPQGLRAYPENPERTTVPTEAGLTAKLAQTTALVPVAGGELTLPEIRIPWWDTETDAQKVAIIPARTLNVQAAPAQPQTTGSQIGNPEQPTRTTPEPALGETEAPSASTGLWVWQTAALILLAGWAMTGFGWWYSKRSRKRPVTAAQNPDSSEKALFTTLCESAKAGAPDTPDHLIRWVQHRHPQSSVMSLGEVYKLLNNEAVEHEIRQLQARAYSQRGGKHGGQQGSTAENWQGDRLVEALSQSRTRMASRSAASSPLPALYPDELNAGPAR
jgi:hypothetical protein